MEPLLACDFSVVYPSSGGGVRNAGFEIHEAEVFGVAGESGSGKSTIALAVAALAGRRGGRVSGSVWFRGRNLLALSERELRAVRGREIYAWHPSGMNKSRLAKVLSGKDLGVVATARNWNTVTKLLAIADS